MVVAVAVVVKIMNTPPVVVLTSVIVYEVLLVAIVVAVVEIKHRIDEMITSNRLTAGLLLRERKFHTKDFLFKKIIKFHRTYSYRSLCSTQWKEAK